MLRLVLHQLTPAIETRGGGVEVVGALRQEIFGHLHGENMPNVDEMTNSICGFSYSGFMLVERGAEECKRKG